MVGCMAVDKNYYAGRVNAVLDRIDPLLDEANEYMRRNGEAKRYVIRLMTPGIKKEVVVKKINFKEK